MTHTANNLMHYRSLSPWLLGLLLALSLGGCAPHTGPSTETRADCEPGKAPATAMQFKYGGFEVELFPPDPGPDYTGCMWARFILQPGVVSEDVYRFERGELSSFKNVSHEPGGISVVTECLWVSGNLAQRNVQPTDSANARKCPDPSEARRYLPQRYKAEAIEGWVVDAETGQPLEGVIIVANWEVKGGFERTPIAQLQILETVTDANGRYFFPAWGPKIVSPIGELDQFAPTLQLFKPSYRVGVFSNFDSGGYAASTFFYNKKTLKLERFKGSQIEYAESLSSLSGSLQHIGYDVGHQLGDYCGWQSFPRMLRALDKLEAEFRAAGVRRGTVVSFLKANDARIREQGCSSIFAVLGAATK